MESSEPSCGRTSQIKKTREAKDSSEIEAIITTHDDLFHASLFDTRSPTAKEVQRYASALRAGFDQVARAGLILDRDICAINELLTLNTSGYRRLPGQLFTRPPKTHTRLLTS